MSAEHLMLVATLQQAGKVCCWIDARGVFDVELAREAGVSLERLLVSQPDTGSQAVEICDALVRCGALDLIVVDGLDEGVFDEVRERALRTGTRLIVTAEGRA